MLIETSSFYKTGEQESSDEGKDSNKNCPCDKRRPQKVGYTRAAPVTSYRWASG